MKNHLAALFVLLTTAGSAQAETVDGGLFGSVKVVRPTGTVNGTVFLFSDRAGWTSADDKALDAIAGKGALAVGVDTKDYLQRLTTRDATLPEKKCASFFGDVEIMSRQLQRLYPSVDYVFPILSGTGEGGTLAYAALAEAPANTFAGAISIDPTADLSVRMPLCPDTTSAADADGRFTPNAQAKLNGFWAVRFDTNAKPTDRARIEALKQAGTPVDAQDAAQINRTTAIADLAAPHLTAVAAHDVESLPLVELPVETPTKKMAIVISGDGGWRDIDKTLADRLQARGIPVVGWDSLRYFWRLKTPDETAADLAAVIKTYATKWKTEKIALIGYSFGADVLPFLYNRLPPALRAKVTLVSLLGLDLKADWEIKVTGWLGAPPSEDATPVAPALAKMPAGLVQCFYGVEETDSACPTLMRDQDELIKTAGGHHFNHDYDRVAKDIVAGFQRRSGL